MVRVPWLAVAMALAAVPPAILGGMVWRDRAEPGARSYALAMATLVAYALVYALTLVIADPAVHAVLYPAASWFKLLFTVLWLLFVLEYTGRSRLVTRRLVVGLLAFPAFVGGVLVTPYREGLFVQDYALAVYQGVVTSSFENGPLWLVAGFVGFVLVGLGVAMLLEFVITDQGPFGRQTAVLAVSGLVPGLTTAAHIAKIGAVPSIDLTPVAITVTVPLVTYAHLRWDLFGFSPATRRIGQATAIDDFGDAVVIVDEDRRVVDLNGQALDLLGDPDPALGQTHVEDLLGVAVDFDASEQMLRVETSRGRLNFELSVSPIDGPRDRVIGYTVVLHDVTDEKQRRQRYEVLNRILRHDLRNTMNAVVGYSRQLEDHIDGTGQWMIDRIEAQSTELVELTEKARDIDRVTNPAQSKTRFPVADSLERVSDRLAADHEDLTVTVHAPDGLSLTSHAVVFEEIVHYAAGSLASYNGTDDPRIVISAAPTDIERPRIEVTIASNGDPVPADERAVIERGEETPLDHSHDLDLWLVSWGVDTLGGDLSFVNGDRPGLSLSIPDVGGAAEGEQIAPD